MDSICVHSHGGLSNPGQFPDESACLSYQGGCHLYLCSANNVQISSLHFNQMHNQDCVRNTKLSWAETMPVLLSHWTYNSQGISVLSKFLMKFLQMCKIIHGFPAGADIVDKAFAAASLYYNYTGDQACFQLEDGEDPHGLSGWGWQVIDTMPLTILR